MIQFFKNLLRKKDRQELQMLKPFAVEARLMLDENTVLDRIACTIHAKSKRDAKWQIKTRAYIKVGEVANKAQIEKYLTKGHEKRSV